MKFFKSNINPYILCSILAFFCVVVIACSGGHPEKKIITVSIQPQKYLLEKIVGDKFDVMCLLSKGSNPEAYEPNMSHIINLEKSDAYFRIGNIGFELAILNKIQSTKPSLKIYNNSTGVDLIEGGHVEDESGHNHEVDPHIWSSVPNMKIIAKNMYDAVIEIDPQHKDYYKTNYENLQKDLTTLNDKISKELADKKGTTFAVWHPSLSYFARDYGLKQISLEYNGKESSIKHMKERINQAKNDSVKVFFYQKEFDGRQAEVINSEIGAKMVTINPMNYDWADEIQATADAIATN